MKFSIGLGTGTVFCIIYLSYALAMWSSYTENAEELDDNCVNNCITGEEVMAVGNNSTTMPPHYCTRVRVRVRVII